MYYLTYYEEYPIYEPAEGGYYYSGCNAVEWAYDENMDDVINYIPKFAEKFDLEIVKFHEGVAEYFRECFDEDFGSIIVAIEKSKYMMLILRVVRAVGIHMNNLKSKLNFVGGI